MLGKRLILSFIIICMLIPAGCGENKSYQKTGFYFDTVVNFCFYGPHAKDAVEACMNASERYDALFNKNNKYSDIYTINHSNGEAVLVSEETVELIKLSLNFYEKSKGLVTPSIGSVSSLWDFKSETPVLPDTEKLNDALNHIDASDIDINGNLITLKDPKCQLDVGFIAKGFMADKLKKLAESLGVSHGWINLGGNVLAIGTRPDGTSFNIGIKNPSEGSDDSITTVLINDESVVTSGVYERCFKIDDILYYHILDTKTGYPVRNSLLSVSVIGPSSAICDGLSTALFVMGTDEGLEFLKSFNGYRAIFITDDLSIITSY